MKKFYLVLAVICMLVIPFIVRAASIEQSGDYTNSSTVYGHKNASGDIGAINAPAETETIKRLTCSAINSEYSYAIPANTKEFTIYEETMTYALRYAWSSGRTTSDSSQLWRAIPAGVGITEKNLNFTGKTIYVRCPGHAGAVAVITTKQ